MRGSLGWLAAVLLGGGLAAALEAGTYRAGPVRQVNLPDEGAAEILACDWAQRLVVVCDPVRRRLVCFELDPDAEQPWRLLRLEDGAAGTPLDGEPTCVALHPDGVALVTVLGPQPDAPGRLVGIDVRPGRRGRIVLEQPLGIGPDNIAISSDGRWALVANEAEEDDRTPGSVRWVQLGQLRWQGDRLAPLTMRQLPGLDEQLGVPLGQCEPEFCAIEPQGRLAAVTCQEQDAVLILDCRGGQPRWAQRIQLAAGAEPDGVALLDGVKSAQGQSGCLLVVAEEGDAQQAGQRATGYWLDPAAPNRAAQPQFRNDLRPWVKGQQCDPEGVALTRSNGAVLAVIGLEKANRVLCLEIDPADGPYPVGCFAVGSAPEGVWAVTDGGTVHILTANEGGGGGGSLSWIRLHVVGDR